LINIYQNSSLKIRTSPYYYSNILIFRSHASSAQAPQNTQRARELARLRPHNWIEVMALTRCNI
jgi:hypothetical protein